LTGRGDASTLWPQLRFWHEKAFFIGVAPLYGTFFTANHWRTETHLVLDMTFGDRSCRRNVSSTNRLPTGVALRAIQ
jgi:hypothetical protein